METKTDYQIQNPEAPATSRQTFALYCMTKIDYRDMGLTRAEASELIRKHQAKEGMDYVKKFKVVTEEEKSKEPSIRSMEAFFNTAEMKRDFQKTFQMVINIKQLVTMTAGGKKSNYVMLGGGCSISWVEFKRLHKAKVDKYEDWMRTVRACFEIEFKKELGKEMCNKLTSIGNPLEAIFAQNIEINSWWVHNFARYFQGFGVNANGICRLD